MRKANPGKLSYASGGHGSSPHLAAELLKAEAKIDIVHVPYKGTGPALQDLIAGHVQMMFSSVSPAKPQIESGKVRALAVTTLERTALLPDIGSASTSSRSRTSRRPPGTRWSDPPACRRTCSRSCTGP